MSVRYRLTLRSTETRPSKEAQDSVLPAMSQKFGQRVELNAADLDPADNRRVTEIGTADVETGEALCDVYGYVKPHNLVKVGDLQTNDAGTVVTRKVHEVDRDQLDDHGNVTDLGEVHGDVLIRLHSRDGSTASPPE